MTRRPAPLPGVVSWPPPIGPPPQLTQQRGNEVKPSPTPVRNVRLAIAGPKATQAGACSAAPVTHNEAPADTEQIIPMRHRISEWGVPARASGATPNNLTRRQAPTDRPTADRSHALSIVASPRAQKVGAESARKAVGQLGPVYHSINH